MSSAQPQHRARPRMARRLRHHVHLDLVGELRAELAQLDIAPQREAEVVPLRRPRNEVSPNRRGPGLLRGLLEYQPLFRSPLLLSKRA